MSDTDELGGVEMESEGLVGGSDIVEEGGTEVGGGEMVTDGGRLVLLVCPSRAMPY